MDLTNPAHAYICNNSQFFEQCPTADPIFSTIVSDFKIRRNGVLINVAALSCTPPISIIPISDYTDELVLLQALRAIYYMDLGRNNHLPWTSKTLYGWLKEKVGGFAISTTASNDQWGGQIFLSEGDTANYFVIRAKNDSTREFQRKWAGPAGISTMITLMMHERRHGDGAAFNHLRCCLAQDPVNSDNGCDQTYEETTNLSPYGIQYWLEKSWVNGYINVGMGCMTPTDKTDAINWMRQDGNAHVYPASSNFCTNTPPLLNDTNNPPAASCTCTGISGSSSGDTHLHTFDGLFYDFQASGDFILVEVDSGMGTQLGRISETTAVSTTSFNKKTRPHFVVQSRQVSGAPTWPNASVNKAVAVQAGNTKIALCLAPVRLKINGAATDLSDGQSISLPDGVDVSRGGNVYFIFGQDGNFVRSVVNSTWIDISVGLGIWPTQVRGLMANTNGNVRQMATRDGAVLTTPFSFDDFYHRYTDSWRVSAKESLLSVCEEKKIERVIPTKPFYAKDLDPKIYERTRAVCTTAGVKAGPLLEACALDVAVIGDDSAAKFFVNMPTPILEAKPNVTRYGGGETGIIHWLLLPIVITLFLWILLFKRRKRRLSNS